MNNRRFTLPVIALSLALLAAGCGSDDGTPSSAPETETITIEDPWVRATEGTEDPSMTAAFMVIDNAGSDDVSLVGASSPVTDMVQLHEMAMVDGAMVMQEVDGGIVVTAGRGKVLQPGGYHIMLMDLQAPVQAGSVIPVTLELRDAQGKALERTLQIPVRPVSYSAGSQQMMHH